MDELIRQIRAAADAGLYYLALFGALALPDICGALASDNGRASGPKYIAWFRQNVPEIASDAETVYGLRCSLLHQGRALPDGGRYPMAFMVPAPGQGSGHGFSIEAFDGTITGYYSIPTFVDQLTRGSADWLAQFGGTATVIRNLEKFARLRPEGMPPHLTGIAVIA